MFTQTFVDGTQKTKKPYTVVVSLLFQIGIICLMILAPLLYTQTLPNAQLKSMLMAPPPPPPPPPRPPAIVKARPTTMTRTLASSVLVAPRVMAKQFPAAEQVSAAPDIGATTASDVGNGNPLLYGSTGPAAQPIPPPPTATSRPPAKTVRVGGGVAEANLLHKVQPLYPALARSARVQGAVEFTAVISKEGRIENLQLLRGHPLLVNAAREAILQWQYRPTMLNGEPVEVVTTITVNFTLGS
ncbi:MAG: energy transducer TonB [Acidobacteriota bacterium]|nr:energy transducer TonB [Acidobacteriota bacterium]